MKKANQFSSSQRAHEKENARVADARALAEGRISSEALRVQNEPFRAVAGPNSRIRLSAARSLY